MQLRNIRPHQWLQSASPNNDKFFIPDVSYVLSSEDWALFLLTLKSLKTPTSYVSSLHRRISKGKLSGLKSHDYHILMQQILPLCLRNIGNDKLVGASVRVSRLFQKLCAQVIEPLNERELLEDCAETMCLIEKEMPPQFFDIMFHLTWHLVQELFICGPVTNRWMYPYERCFKNLKGMVRNFAHPKDCIALGYEVEESLGFVTESMAKYRATDRRVWDSKEYAHMNDEEVEGRNDNGCTPLFWITPSMSKSIDCKFDGYLVYLKHVLISLYLLI
jgi:hypothetical protein